MPRSKRNTTPKSPAPPAKEEAPAPRRTRGAAAPALESPSPKKSRKTSPSPSPAPRGKSRGRAAKEEESKQEKGQGDDVEESTPKKGRVTRAVVQQEETPTRGRSSSRKAAEPKKPAPVSSPAPKGRSSQKAAPTKVQEPQITSPPSRSRSKAAKPEPKKPEPKKPEPKPAKAKSQPKKAPAKKATPSPKKAPAKAKASPKPAASRSRSKGKNQTEDMPSAQVILTKIDSPSKADSVEDEEMSPPSRSRSRPAAKASPAKARPKAASRSKSSEKSSAPTRRGRSSVEATKADTENDVEEEEKTEEDAADKSEAVEKSTDAGTESKDLPKDEEMDEDVAAVKEEEDKKEVEEEETKAAEEDKEEEVDDEKEDAVEDECMDTKEEASGEKEDVKATEEEEDKDIENDEEMAEDEVEDKEEKEVAEEIEEDKESDVVEAPALEKKAAAKEPDVVSESPAPVEDEEAAEESEVVCEPPALEKEAAHVEESSHPVKEPKLPEIEAISDEEEEKEEPMEEEEEEEAVEEKEEEAVEEKEEEAVKEKEVVDDKEEEAVKEKGEEAVEEDVVEEKEEEVVEEKEEVEDKEQEAEEEMEEDAGKLEEKPEDVVDSADVVPEASTAQEVAQPTMVDGEQRNGSNDPRSSPSRKRKWDDMEDEGEEQSPKKVRRSIDMTDVTSEGIVTTNGENEVSARESSDVPMETDTSSKTPETALEQSTTQAGTDNIDDSYVIIEMDDVPGSKSAEVLESLPEEGKGPASEQSQQTTTTQEQNMAAVESHPSDNNPLFSRKFIANPSYHQKGDINKQFSVVSYNILAQCHLERNDYSFTESRYLVESYRHQNLVKEVEYLKGDIVCMQEVGPAYYESLLKPEMARLGYEGLMKKRTEEYFDEGEATFYKTSRFSVVQTLTYSLKDLIEQELDDGGVSDEVKTSIRKYLDLPDVLVLTKLRCSATGDLLCVGNIHVQWGRMEVPDAQCIQITCSIKEIAKQAGSDCHALILCGDFNSEASSAGYKLVREGYLTDEPLKQLQSLENLQMADSSKAALVNHLWRAFQSPINLKSAYETSLGSEPVVTSYNRVMLAAVDYIFYGSRLENVGVLQTASEGDVKATGGLPDQTFPSDHVSLKAVFAFS